MALARACGLSFSYPEDGRALDGVSLEIEPGELVALLGPSGSGKSTLLRAFAGLVPHFHGGRFAGRVDVAGLDTRRHRPAELAGTVACLFQDPEDQVVFTRVENEIAFGLENIGVEPGLIPTRVEAALELAGAVHLKGRRVEELSGGELQRVCLASALALEPQLLLLDEPTSQLDSEVATALLERCRARGTAVLVSEQRPALPLEHADRVVFMEEGRILLDAPRAESIEWLARERPAWLGLEAQCGASEPGDLVCRLEDVSFAYPGGPPVVDGFELGLRRGEVVVLTGPNGSGKTTLAKLAAGLLLPARGVVTRSGRAAYLSQDPGRYLVRERADEEVALGVGGDLRRARAALERVGLAGHAERHPRDLSSGERERLALAAVLVTEPELLILDEPTRGIDPERKQRLAALLRAEVDDRATLVVTHDRAFASVVCDREIALGASREAALA